MVRKTTTYQMQHDGREYTVNVAGLKTPKCEKSGLVHPDDEAMRAITFAFLRQANLLTPAQIRAHRLQAKFSSYKFRPAC